MRRWYAVAATVCAGWGTIPLLVQWIDLPAAAVAFSRVAVAAVALAVAVRLTPSERGRPPVFGVHRSRSILTAAMLGVHWLALFGAYGRAPAGTVILVVYLAPVGVAALAPVVLGERLGPSTLAALGVGVAGVALLAGPAVRGSGVVGLAMSVFTMATFVALVLLSKPLAEAYGGLRLAFMEMAGATVVLLPGALTTSWGEPRVAWLWLLVLGVVHTALAIALYLRALERLPATHVGIIGYLEPVAVLVVSWAVLSERPTSLSMMGGVLVLAAGVLVVAVPARAPEHADPPLEATRARR